MSDIDYVTLCIKDISGEIKPGDKEVLSEWLAKSPENQKLYDQYKKIKNLESRYRIKSTINSDTVWQELHERILRRKHSKYSQIFQFVLKSFGNIFLQKYRRLVFAVCIFLLFLFVAIPIKDYFISSETLLIVTQNREKKTVILPDQSKVILNSGSRLEYQKNFYDGNRSVILNGEAFFSIRKNRVPFIVTSMNASITVLGTEFNVWARKNRTRVVVKEGSVRFNSNNDEDKFVQLAKNQMSTILNGNKPEKPENVNVELYLGWLENKLVFQKTPLPDVIAEIERFYDVSIKLDEKLNNKYLTGRFIEESVDSILKKICLVFDAMYTYGSGVYYVKVK